MQDDSPIKAIQQFARRHKIPLEYRLEKEFGPISAKMYAVRLQLGSKSYMGTERTMALAQRAAARNALEDQKYFSSNAHSDGEMSPSHVAPSPLNSLNQWAIRNHQRLHYVFLQEQNLNQSARPIVFYRLYLRPDLYFDGHGPSHHQARSHCAFNALCFLRQNPISPPSTPQSVSSPSGKSNVALMYERAKQLGLVVRVQWNDPCTVTYRIGEHYSSTGHGYNRQAAKLIAAENILKLLPNPSKTKSSPTINPITRLYQLAQSRQVQVQFAPLEKSPSHDKYSFRVTFGEKDSSEGHGPTKQLAKRAAAETLLEKLDPVVVLPPPPGKSLLKKESHTDGSMQQPKKHVHFDEHVIAKDEELAMRPCVTLASPTIAHYQKQQLADTCRRMNIDVKYTDERNENDHSGSARFYSVVSLSKDDHLLAQFRGQGPSLMRAQENASSAAWNRLKQLFNRSNVTKRSP